MYYHVCLILLALHNLSLTNPYASEGKNPVHAIREAARALKALDRQIRFHVRALCGIALCNSYLAPAMTMASAAVTLCGEHFVDDVDEGEQQALLDVLVQNEAKHGWPTKVGQQHLKKIWNWE
jgi:hypothetical protein